MSNQQLVINDMTDTGMGCDWLKQLWNIMIGILTGMIANRFELNKTVEGTIELMTQECLAII